MQQLWLELGFEPVFVITLMWQMRPAHQSSVIPAQEAAVSLLRSLFGKDDTIAEQEKPQLPHPAPIQTAFGKLWASLLCAPF